jgi:hypothetical protein
MTAAEILAQVEALGVVVTLDREDLVLRPRSRLTPELVEQLRAHKAEIQGLVELQSWPETSRDAVRRFGHPVARLYPFLGRTIVTPDGPGRLHQVFPDRATVVLDARPTAAAFYLPAELRPPDAAGAATLTDLTDLTDRAVH